MPFTTAGDSVSRGQDETLLASGVVTATGTSTGMDVGGAGTLRAQVQVTNITGGTSPTLTVTIQTSHDNGATDAWRTAAATAVYSAINSVSNSPWANFTVDRYVRVSYAVTGSPTGITFAVVGEAV